MKGNIGIFDRSWYSRATIGCLSKEKSKEKNGKLLTKTSRNRCQWDDNKIAVDEMLQKTSTINDPWIVVEANDKRCSIIKVMKTTVEALE